MTSKYVTPGIALALFGVCLYLSSAGAQEAKEPSRPVYSVGETALALIMRADVQSELKLDAAQRKAIVDLRRTSRNDRGLRYRQNYQDLHALPPDERARRADEFRAKLLEQNRIVNQNVSDKLQSLLKPEQLKRLHEIDLQATGPFALVQTPVADEVGVSSDNREKIARLAADYQKQARDTMAEAMRPQREASNANNYVRRQALETRLAAARQKNATLKRDIEAKILALLTEDEKNNWAKAKGSTFRFNR